MGNVTILKDLQGSTLQFVETLEPSPDEKYIFQRYPIGQVVIFKILKAREDVEVSKILQEISVIIYLCTSLDIAKLKIHTVPSYCSFLFYDGPVSEKSKAKVLAKLNEMQNF